MGRRVLFPVLNRYIEDMPPGTTWDDAADYITHISEEVRPWDSCHIPTEEEVPEYIDDML